MNARAKYRIALLVLPLLIVAAVVGCGLVGAADVGWRELWHSDIFWQLRLPREVMALVVGAVLAVSGGCYQAVFRNPLTDPYLLGVSSGASLGAAIAILVGLDGTLYGVDLAALVTALLTLAIIYLIADRRGGLHTTALLLAGVCLTLLISAIVSLLTVMHHDKMDRIIFWTMGSLATAAWADVAVVATAAVAGIAIVMRYRRELNLMLAGNEAARSMGVDVERTTRIVLLTTTLMVALTVAACGVIGFVGLIVPHGVRLMTGADHRRLLPLSALTGALFLLLCDTASRTLFLPSELPIGSLTAIVGAPVFIALICRRHTLH